MKINFENKIKKLNIGDTFTFERKELPAVKSAIGKQKDLIVISAPKGKYKLMKV